MKDSKIEKLVEQFLIKRDKQHCHASFDYCFNYFQSFKNKAQLATPENIEKSCLHLGYFLASWGMFRWKILLKKTSLSHYKKVIREIATWNGQNECAPIWKIDANKYIRPDTKKCLIQCYCKIESAMTIEKKKPSATLTTKIMLGIFGCVPAFDSKFKKAFNVGRFGESALEKIVEFYDNHKDVIDSLGKRTKTLDFETDNETGRCYTRAKIIDMIGFQKKRKAKIRK